ncbi:uncharacterized protein [Parasteatoda tepidariorum]|uniref:uncharacterized protein n=1 Tax=Parasteatoda tepidariorum TaxID=114398 RepID=UPI00077FB0C7|nr:uncharacterized protein LOC107447982 [Parasteatoda tepidariorum]XP_042897312.1 uncharacterized protein LOC107447982 [Parasteatoda tepidariorum]
MLLKLMALVTALVHMVSAQTREGSVLKQGENEDSQSVIVTARSRAFLSCESGDMVVKVNFTQPFRGLMYAHRSRNSPCRIHGTGGNYYELRIPLKGCGTWQESPRMFVNNITIRFHPALELEEDETKTVVCRYPPPLTPSPGGIQVIDPPTSILPTTTPTRVGTARLSEVEILIIICLLLFLSLLILGIGIAYFCLKRRNIRIIRKSTTAVSSAPPSQITRLSSSNLYPPSSLLSSVLGHTVRIPRAVPYSAPVGRTSALSSPEHQYEDYPASTSTAETSSGEISETSVSSSSSEDQTDASKYLLTRKGFPRSILSIPKAILRRNGTKRWKTEATIHQYQSKSDASTQSTSVKKPEMEDQTITTMLEPENHFDDDSFFIVKRRLSDIPEIKTSLERTESETTGSPQKVPVPVYAQVHKPKKSPVVKRTESVKKSGEFKGTPPKLSGPERRMRQVQTVTPEVIKTTEEVTKNTTMITSVRREIAETRILAPLHENLRKERTDPMDQQEIRPDSLEVSSMEYQLNGNKSETSTLISNVPKLDVAKESKSLLIRDVADIYLTTTVETELTEQTTTVSRDIFGHHVKNDEKQPDQPPLDKNKEQKPPKLTSVTNQWNVVIRQKEPPVQNVNLFDSNLDASSESNAESSDEPTSEVKPKFDVKIRTILPEKLKPKTFDGMINIPPLEMPATVNMLKEALMPKKPETDKNVLPKEPSTTEEKKEWYDEDKSNIPQRTVRWMDDVKATKNSTVSSSDSFQSAESLRERSSSEVLEVAPTLPSQQKPSSHPVLERSSSEITTSPDDQVRWVGGVVPVLESLSPEFLANIPVVIQGGFFNRQKTNDKD